MKYPTRQYAISPQPVIWFKKFLKLLNPDTSLNLTYIQCIHFTLIYITIPPCKMITIEITIFIIVLVLKSNENMEIWHFRLSQLDNSSKSWEKKFEHMFKAKILVQSVRSQLSHKLEVYWQSSVWPCWWSSVADHPILFARLSSAHRWYLAWVELSCSVQA